MIARTPTRASQFVRSVLSLAAVAGVALTDVWAGLFGYASVALSSLASRRSWPSWVRFAVAGTLALAGAVASVAIAGNPISLETVRAAFGVSLPAQLATWHLQIPGAGSSSVNERLLDIGDRLESFDAEDALGDAA